MDFLKWFVPTSALSCPTPVPRIVTPRLFPTTGFTSIPSSEIVEEENWPWYTLQSFYPVHIGDVLHSKYQVLYKLGYGTTATIWMCRDLRSVFPPFHLST
jgi:serine/threonine-protein kinase SRPK3